MARIIMLIPLDEDVGLNTISLSFIYFLNKNKCRYQNNKSILYFSCINTVFDDSTLIINKYFSKFVDVFSKIDFSKKDFNSLKYCSLINKIIKYFYHQKSLYEFVLIKGMYRTQNIYANEINYDIAQNLSADVIFIANLENDSLECAKEKEDDIKNFLKYKKYKNILGVIFNNVNSPFIRKKYDFLKKIKILTDQNRKCIIENSIFHQNSFSILACIPWNKNFFKANILDINNFLSIELIISKNIELYTVEKVVIFNKNFSDRFFSQDFANALIIFPFSCLDIFIEFFSLKLNKYNISGILLTEACTSEKYMIVLCQLFIDHSIPILFTKKNITEIIYQLQSFNFNICNKDQIYIEKLQKYVSGFFNKKLLFKNNNTYKIGRSPKEFCYFLKILSSEYNKRIILPESYEPRVLKAVSICHNLGIATCILLGNPKKIYSVALSQGIKISKKIEIIDPDCIRHGYISRLINLRKDKGMNELSAIKQLKNNTILATLILEENKVDGLVSGAINTTADTIRPAFQIIKTHPKNMLVSSIFFMLFENQVFIYGDCAINIDPTAEELAEIAIQSANSAENFGILPKIAMLSYSTGFSGFGYQVEKVRNATLIVKKRRPDLVIDGPIQYDAAVSQAVCKIKNPDSPIFGDANVFIFPDLNSGNITYKAVQRALSLISIGPMLQGLKKPVNDLSRGASVEDIIYTVALTSIQSASK